MVVYAGKPPSGNGPFYVPSILGTVKQLVTKLEESSDENKVPKAIYLGKIPSLCMTTGRSLDTQLQLATVRMFWSASGLVAKCGKLAETRQS